MICLAKRFVLTVGAFALVALGIAIAPGEAHAADDATCQVYEIKASNGAGGVDPALRGLAKKLGKPPFSSWKTFELLKKHDRGIEQMKAFEVGLVPGGKLSLLYRDRSDPEGKKPRLRLSFTLDDKAGKRKLDGTIKLDSGDYYLIGGDELEGGGTYILAVSCAVK